MLKVPAYIYVRIINRSRQFRIHLFIEDGRGPQRQAERAKIFVFQNIFVLLEVPSMVWSQENSNVGMNPSSIQLEFEQYFAKAALLLNGSYFNLFVLSHGNQNTGMNPDHR